MTNGKMKTSIEEIKVLAAFWQSPTGKLAIQHIERLKDGNLEKAMGFSDKLAQPNEASCAFLYRARGIKAVLDDIQMIINRGNELNKEGDSSDLGTK